MISSWSGAAQETYLQCKKQWDDASQALAQVLQQIGQAVGTAHDELLGRRAGRSGQLVVSTSAPAPSRITRRGSVFLWQHGLASESSVVHSTRRNE